MKVINIQHPHHFKQSDFEQMVLALGFFDGVHLGHQKVINTAVETAKEKGLKCGVMTFFPHPSVVLKRNVDEVKYITPLEEKIRIIGELNVDYLFVVEFSETFADLLPQEFVDDYIIGLNAVHVVAGFDYTYGKMGKGTMETLTFHSRNFFDYTVVPKLTNGTEKISSTLIRSCIRSGQFERLPSLLGRFYTTKGVVVHGDKRGRTIGFPTANTAIDESYILPPVGVYTVRSFVDGQWYEGICNVGYKPTFKDDKKLSVEVHIFDFNKDIYGREIIVEWHHSIRPEKKFSSVDALIAQLEADKAQALRYFEKMRQENLK